MCNYNNQENNHQLRQSNQYPDQEGLVSDSPNPRHQFHFFIPDWIIERQTNRTEVEAATDYNSAEFDGSTGIGVEWTLHSTNTTNEDTFPRLN